jgi:hypothetical protein
MEDGWISQAASQPSIAATLWSATPWIQRRSTEEKGACTYVTQRVRNQARIQSIRDRACT